MDVSEFNGTTSFLDTSWHLSPSIFGALSSNLQNKIPMDTCNVGREVTVQILLLIRHFIVQLMHTTLQK